MKQTNKLLNISNILNYVFVLMIGFFVVNYFEQYGLLFSTVVVFVSGIANFVIGIINIVKRNKKIGILNIIIAVMFIFDAIMFNIIDDVDEWMYFIVLACIVAPIVLTILNLIFNRKNTDLKKKRYKTILFLLGILTEIIIIIIPIVVNKINVNSLHTAVNELINDINKTRIIESSFNETRFYDEDGNVLFIKPYRLLDTCDTFVTSNNDKQMKVKTLTVITVEDNNQIWIVDYNGNKIRKLYNLFESNGMFDDTFLQKNGYLTPDTQDSSEYLKFLYLSENTDNIYKFGSIEEFGYEIVVKINEKELETDTDLYSKIDDFEKKEYYKDLKELEKFYKFKKEYYLINQNKELKKLDCNNMIFSIDNMGKVRIKLYSNGYIPYYDKDSTGFFNNKGEKFSFNKNYLVIGTTDNFAIVHNINDKRNFAFLYNNRNVENLGDYSIDYYDNKYIIMSHNAFIFKNDKLFKLSSDYDELRREYRLIVCDIEKNSRYSSPYGYQFFNNDNMEKEITPDDLIYNN